MLDTRTPTLRYHQPLKGLDKYCTRLVYNSGLRVRHYGLVRFGSPKATRQFGTTLVHRGYLYITIKLSTMKENIHLKISASDKQELAARAKELGLSLSSYIRLRLKESSLPREVTLREVMSY